METEKKQATVFKYETPTPKSAKTVVRLCRSDLVYANVQVITHGGENNMHSHTALDGIWIVLKGKARFYGEGDKVIADLGPLEGIMIPRNFQYWFESSSEELLELLQVEAIDKSVLNQRMDHRPKTEATLGLKVVEAVKK